MKIFLFLILLLLSCKSVQNYKPIENSEDKALIKKWIVTPDSGLNLRDAPSRKGKSIRLLPRGTMVSHKQLPENEKPDTIEDQKGKWLKVEVENESGWVFDVYLSEPVFSPSGDKFYFVTVKHRETGMITTLNGGYYCRHEYEGAEHRCLIEIRNKENVEVIKAIKHQNIIGWYDDKNIINNNSLGDAGYYYDNYDLMDINTIEETNLYTFSTKIFLDEFGLTKENRVCIFNKCLGLEREGVKLNMFYVSNIVNKNIYTSPKRLIEKLPIRRNQDFEIKPFSREQILKLKHPYTGNIEFSVDKRNYLLHVPTGKITEVKEK